MTQTEWIISLDDDLKDHDELFVGNVRDGDRLTRCRDCRWHKEKRCTVWRERAVIVECYTDDDGYCYLGEPND